jgi:serine/threonine protein kinase/tetratricopeptide (TPR) repeat protein
LRFIRRKNDTKSDSLGHYQILQKLGQGGMGEVYEAHDPRLGRSVAIKRILTSTKDPRANERLWREARAAAQVNHPNICQIFEIGEGTSGPFLVMELLQGRSLTSRLADGPLPPLEALRIAREALAGLEAIHARGLVHRDLKPSNLYLTPHGTKLLDFGLARLSQGSGDGSDGGAGLTQTGAVVGTPRYMAPEQLQGRPLDGRSDLFALGAILYEMLSGSPAFSGENPIQIFQSILHDPTPTLGGGMPPVLAQVVRRALAKRPEERYVTAREMTEAIQAVEAGLRGVPTTSQTALAPSLRRLIVLPFQILRPDPEIDYLSFSLADALTSALSGINSLLVRSSLAGARYAKELPDLDQIAAEADVDCVLTGTLLRHGDQLRVKTQLAEVPGGSLIWSHSTQASVHDIFQLEDELKQRVVASLSVPLSERERRLLQHDVPADPHAYEFYLRAGQQGEGPSHWRIARDLCLRAVEADPHYAPAWVRLGRSYLVLGKYTSEGQESMRKAVDALERALSLNPELPMAHHLYAKVAVNTGRPMDGLRYLLTHAEGHRNDPEFYAGLNMVLRFGGLLEPSLEAHLKARALDPKVSTSAAYTYYFLGRFQEAFDESHHEPSFQAMLLHLMGRTEEGFAMLDRAAHDHDDFSLSLSIRSMRASLQGDPSLFEQMLELGRNFPDPEGKFEVGLWMCSVGKVDNAVEVLDEAIRGEFYALPAMRNHPWIPILEAHPRYPELLANAQEGRRRAVRIYEELGGERFLGVPADG